MEKWFENWTRFGFYYSPKDFSFFAIEEYFGDVLAFAEISNNITTEILFFNSRACT